MPDETPRVAEDRLNRVSEVERRFAAMRQPMSFGYVNPYLHRSEARVIDVEPNSEEFAPTGATVGTWHYAERF